LETGSTKKQVELFEKGFAPLNRFIKIWVFFINQLKFSLFVILSFVETEKKTDSDSNSEDRVETVLRATNPPIVTVYRLKNIVDLKQDLS
jgi:hypothetical protein